MPCQTPPAHDLRDGVLQARPSSSPPGKRATVNGRPGKKIASVREFRGLSLRLNDRMWIHDAKNPGRVPMRAGLGSVAILAMALGCGHGGVKEVSHQATPDAKTTRAAPSERVDWAYDRAQMALAGIAATNENSGPTPLAALDDRKIIFMAEMTIVVGDFGAVEQTMPALVRKHGGYIASASVQGSANMRRSGRWVVRIPVDQFDAFLDAAASLGIPEQRQQTSQEVTEEFVDLQSRIANTRKLEERILRLLETSSGGLKETVELEHELARVRGQVEQMEGRLRYLADRTTLTTVTLSIREEQNYVPPQSPTFAARMESAFSGSLASLRRTSENLAVWGAQAAPWLAIAAVPGVPVAVLLRRRWRRFRASWRGSTSGS
jgi:hypothetical protein